MPTFGANAEMFRGVNNSLRCLLALCTYEVVVQRVRIEPVGVVIHIDRPLQVDGDIETKNGYAKVAFGGCSVAWKLEQQA